MRPAQLGHHGWPNWEGEEERTKNAQVLDGVAVAPTLPEALGQGIKVSRIEDPEGALAWGADRGC